MSGGRHGRKPLAALLTVGRGLYCRLGVIVDKLRVFCLTEDSVRWTIMTASRSAASSRVNRFFGSGVTVVEICEERCEGEDERDRNHHDPCRN